MLIDKIIKLAIKILIKIVSLFLRISLTFLVVGVAQCEYVEGALGSENCSKNRIQYV